jgi:hypothetical protein
MQIPAKQKLHLELLISAKSLGHCQIGEFALVGLFSATFVLDSFTCSKDRCITNTGAIVTNEVSKCTQQTYTSAHFTDF